MKLVTNTGFIGLKNLEINNKNIKRLRYKTWNNNLNELTAVGFRESTVLKGINFINNGDGSWTIKGKKTETSSAEYSFLAGSHDFPVSNGDKLLFTKVSDYSRYSVAIYSSYKSSYHGHITDFKEISNSSSIFTVNNASAAYVGMSFVVRTNDYVDIIVAPQAYNLTKIYGAGKEPTTVEQFYKDYPLAKTSPLGFSDLGIIPSNSGYILNKYDNLSEELLEENVEKDTVNYHIPNKTNISLNKVEGKTNKIVQLVDKSNYEPTGTRDGVIFTNNGNGTYTINGTSTASDYSDYSFLKSTYFTNDWLKGHKYLFYFSDKTDLNYYAVVGGSTSKLEYSELGYTLSGTRTPMWKIIEPTETSIGGNSYFILRVRHGATCTKELASPQLFDLTAMYGFGNEPTTVEQFKKDYPQFFDEKLDGIWNVRTSGISTTGKNLFDVNNAANNNGSASYSISNDEIIVTQNDKTTWVSANFPIKNPGELVGKTISISCLAKSSGINKPSIRVQWMTPNGYAIGDIAAISMPSTSTTFLGLSASGTVPEKPATADMLRFMFYSNSDGDLSGSTDSIFSCTYKDIQLEISDSATDYELYQENKIDLLSTQILNGINGVNDYIEVIDKGNGLYDLKKTQNIDSVDLGTLNWEKTTVFYVKNSTASAIKANSDGLCKEFLVLPSTTPISTEDYIETRSDNYLYFRFQSNSIYKDMTTVQFKTAMNGVILYYQLKTPVITTIATNLTYNQVSAVRTNGGLLLVNDNNNQKYAQPNVTIKSNYQYKS